MPDDPISQVLRDTTAVFEAQGIQYAITGSVASSIHGEPVTSQDIDIVVCMTPAQARELARALPPSYYRDEHRLIEIAEHSGLSNLVEMNLAYKVDISCPVRSEFVSSVFRRRRLAPIGPEPDAPQFYFVSPEDIILMKLEWRKDTGSRKQWENALGVVRVHGARLDWKYLFEQARALGIDSDLKALRDEGGV